MTKSNEFTQAQNQKKQTNQGNKKKQSKEEMKVDEIQEQKAEPQFKNYFDEIVPFELAEGEK